MRPKFQKQSALKLDSRISKSQVSEAKLTEICWTNYPLCKTQRDIPHSGGQYARDFTATVSKIEALANFEIAALDLDVLKIAESIDVPLEMHDKLIVATAIRYEACLITRDEQITKSKIVKTIW